VKIAFDSRPAGDPRGIGRYTRSLLTALRDEAADRGGEVVEANRHRGADCFHTPWIDGALLRPRAPVVVTVHDLVPLKRPGEYLRSGLRFRMRYLAVERSTRLIVPTQVVADDAVELLHVTGDRIDVIPEAADPAFRPRSPEEVARVRERHKLPEQYLVWVGGLRHPDPRKRVAAMTETRRELPLVLVGDPGQWARELDDVILTGAVSDDELAAIYTGAHALVFPSDDEGFGLPTVEALACGTPVVACDVPALREVLGDRATFVDCDDLDALLAAAVSARRPAPAPPDWTWADAARATWDSYQRACEQSEDGSSSTARARRREKL
jgi:glycosyltransferase involved in cell wall biosynthesis